MNCSGQYYKIIIEGIAGKKTNGKKFEYKCK